MFSVLDRYLVREVMQTWLAVTFVLMFILISGRLANLLAKAGTGQLPGDLLFALLGFEILGGLSLIIPATLYLAQMFTLGRLYKDSEIAAMFGCGVSVGQLFRALFVLAVPLFVVLTALSVWVTPWAEQQARGVKAEAETRYDLSVLSPGRFQEAKGSGRVLYVESIDEKTGVLNNVFFYGLRGDNPAMASAARGYIERDPQTGERYAVLENGYRYDGRPGEDKFRIIRFERHGILLQQPEREMRESHVRAIPTRELWESDEWSRRVELHWRLTTPVMLLVLTFLVVPVGRSKPRQGRYAKFLLAIVVYVLYSNLMGSARVWMDHGETPAFFGIWWVHVVGALAALILLARWLGLRWTLRRLIRGRGGAAGSGAAA